MVEGKGGFKTHHQQAEEDMVNVNPPVSQSMDRTFGEFTLRFIPKCSFLAYSMVCVAAVGLQSSG